ncbi:heparan-alpha-glucosaminide N-acetyltransferase domain-containing protein [Pseudonocardia sp. CA-142604]|uniref:heparan-alpha-glucosaminide N-acetyltransferase domain-containing protein n=1 Tax=Pseudonocardia sp. CA-142604 TaxID=3240024 RepID=UPI003D8F296C
MDLARGLALLGMMAAHVFDAAEPSTVTTAAADWSVTTFALVAGVSLALMFRGKRARRERAAVRAGIAVHAVLVAVIGLALGFTGRADIVLPCFAVLFLLAIPLLGLRPWTLTRIAAVSLLVAPPMITATLAGAVPGPVDNPTFATLVTDPAGLAIGLFVTGFYPVIAYLAYICAGLAIGRMDLLSVQVAYRLLLAGLGTVAVGMLWLMLPLPHPRGWMVLIHDVHGLGAAIAVVGASLLVVHVPVIARLLWPIRTAGAMPLTLYSAHVLVLVPGVLEHEPAVLFLSLIAGGLLFEVVWRALARQQQGPLEWLVGAASRRVRRAVRGPRGAAGPASHADHGESRQPTRRQGCRPASTVVAGSARPRPRFPHKEGTIDDDSPLGARPCRRRRSGGRRS